MLVTGSYSLQHTHQWVKPTSWQSNSKVCELKSSLQYGTTHAGMNAYKITCMVLMVGIYKS